MSKNANIAKYYYYFLLKMPRCQNYEASDTSNKEQASHVLRFADKNFDVREEFLSFLHYKSTLSRKVLRKHYWEQFNS